MNRRQFLKLSTASAVVGIIGSYPVLIERYLVQMNRYRIFLPRLPRQFEGFTIVHLTDLHHGPLVSLSFLQDVIRIFLFRILTREIHRFGRGRLLAVGRFPGWGSRIRLSFLNFQFHPGH